MAMLPRDTRRRSWVERSFFDVPGTADLPTATNLHENGVGNITMFEDCSGRFVKSVEDAECYIWKFIAENHCCEDRHVTAHNHDYDLYLPWLMEILEYQKTDKVGAMAILDIQQFYMDAAWDLVMKGYLRPGTRSITGDPLKDGYGKGYSLTMQGRARLAEETRRFRASEKSLT
jgi:hypothetical protein